MKKVRRLLRTPRPYPDENLKGLTVRATEENGYDMSSALTTLANVVEDFRTKRTIYTEQKWKNLSEMFNIDVPTLRDLACLTGIEETPPKAYNMFGHKIHKYSVRVGAPKVCPECLREKEYIRKIWDLGAFTCCPKHGTLLIDQCPKCGNAIWWSRGRVSVCPCGQDWRDIDLPQVSETGKILSRLILKVCGLWKSNEAADEGMRGEKTGNPLSSVGLSEMLCAVYFIAGQQHGVVDATGKHYAVKLPHKELHEALTNAVSVFENWPHNYFKFLEECKDRHYTGERQAGLYKDFGMFYDPLFIRKGNPLPDFMRDAFKQYITTQWDGGYAGRCGSLSFDDLKGKTYMTKWETMKYLGVSLQTVNLLHKKGYLKGPYYPWVNRSRIMIEADSVRELKERWDKSKNAQQAGEILGVGRIAVVSLMKSGCLAAIQGPILTGQLEWKFEVCEVETLLQLALAKIPEGRMETTGCVSFHKAIQKLSKLSIEVGAFVKLIIDGKVRPTARGAGIGLSGLLFDANEISQFSRAEAVKRRGDMRTLHETAKLLRTKDEEVALLIERGLLSAEKTAEGRGGTWAIAQKEIDRFNAIYCTMGWMADVLCTSTRDMHKRLMAVGIMPVTGPKIDGGRMYYYKKTDLESVDLSAIMANRRNRTLSTSEKGLIGKNQMAKMTGYPTYEIGEAIDTGKIVPAKTKIRNNQKNRELFFSVEQIEEVKELMAKESRQFRLFDAPGTAIRLAA